MKTLLQNLIGNVEVHEDTELHGEVKGDFIIKDNVTCRIFGTVIGNLEMSPGSRVFMYGLVKGNVINRGGLFDKFGKVGGRIFEKVQRLTKNRKKD